MIYDLIDPTIMLVLVMLGAVIALQQCRRLLPDPVVNTGDTDA